MNRMKSYENETGRLEGNLNSGNCKINRVDTSLDDFINARPRILKTKMQVFASEIIDRWLIKKENIDNIDRDIKQAETMLSLIDKQARYNLRRDNREKSGFYQLLFGLERERRSEYVSCWNDVSRVVRDFLNVWEAFEQGKARGRLLRGGS